MNQVFRGKCLRCMIVPAVHDRACGHRGLLPAGRTFPARPAPLQFPAPVMAAGGADEAVGPAPGGEMPGTGGFIGKARLEGGAGHGAVIVPAAGHHETLHEHPADAHQKLNISSNRAQRDKPYQEVRIVPEMFECKCCELQIRGLDELMAAGIEHEFRVLNEQDVLENFQMDVMDFIDIEDIIREYQMDQYGWRGD